VLLIEVLFRLQLLALQANELNPVISVVFGLNTFDAPILLYNHRSPADLQEASCVPAFLVLHSIILKSGRNIYKIRIWTSKNGGLNDLIEVNRWLWHSGQGQAAA
jgi:hypothetical protein